ncbi:hypothetical protein F4818DRAFT_438033 [Hypoxylon cercidicola]|nr:hypothetical protein F4818DRAFT_438033 [Hypoxylon cercidicola]
MPSLSFRDDMSLSIEPTATRRRNVYEAALQVLGRRWTWPDRNGQPFQRQLESETCKTGEFTGGFLEAYHVAVMRILLENERQQLRAAESQTPHLFQMRLGTPVMFIAPSRPNLPGGPEEDLPSRLLHSMLSNLLTYLEDLNLCGRRIRYLTVEEIMEVLEKIEPHQWPNYPVRKYLCIITELDRSHSADTMDLVHRMIRELERIFIDGEKGDVFYFFDQRWGVAPVLKSLRSMMDGM